jgi:hypothetical protein
MSVFKSTIQSKHNLNLLNVTVSLLFCIQAVQLCFMMAAASCCSIFLLLDQHFFGIAGNRTQPGSGVCSDDADCQCETSEVWSISVAMARAAGITAWSNLVTA